MVEANLLVLNSPEAEFKVFNVGGGPCLDDNRFLPGHAGHHGQNRSIRLSKGIIATATPGIFSPIRPDSKGSAGSPDTTSGKVSKATGDYLNEQEDIENILEYAEHHMKRLHVIRKARDRRMKAFLLAAGLGTRLAPYTDDLPKCLIPIHDKPLLGIWLALLKRHGIDEVLINNASSCRSGRTLPCRCEKTASVSGSERFMKKKTAGQRRQRF